MLGYIAHGSSPRAAKNARRTGGVSARRTRALVVRGEDRREARPQQALAVDEERVERFDARARRAAPPRGRDETHDQQQPHGVVAGEELVFQMFQRRRERFGEDRAERPLDLRGATRSPRNVRVDRSTWAEMAPRLASTE